MEKCVICFESLSISPFHVKAEKAREKARLRAEYCKANSVTMFGCRQRRPYGGNFLTQNFKSNLRNRRTNFDGIGNMSNPFVEVISKGFEAETVIVQECGHLSHLTCLEVRHRAFRPIDRASRITDPIECPACGKAITLTRVRVIDFAAHEGFIDKFSKDIQYLEIMTKELEDQFHDGLSKYESTDKALHDLLPIVNGLQTRVETCQLANYRHKMLKETKQGISETEATLNVMQEHNITLVKTLLSILKEYSPKTIASKEILPTELIPALELVKNDPNNLQKLVDIVAPRPNSLSPLTLAAQILSTVGVGKTSLDDRLEKFHEELKKQVTLRQPASPPSTRVPVVIPMPTVEEEVENTADEDKTNTAEITWIKKASKPHYNITKRSAPKKSARSKFQERLKKLQMAQEEKNATAAIVAGKKSEIKKATSCSQTDKCLEISPNDDLRAGQLSDSSVTSRRESPTTARNEKIENDKKDDEMKLELLFARRLANNGGESYNIISKVIPELSTSNDCDFSKRYYNITQSRTSALPLTNALSSEQSCSEESEDESDPEESKCPSDSDIQSLIKGTRTLSTQTMEVETVLPDFSTNESSNQTSEKYIQDPYNTFMETPAVCGKLQVKKRSCSFWIPNTSNCGVSVDKESNLEESPTITEEMDNAEVRNECRDNERPDQSIIELSSNKEMNEDLTRKTSKNIQEINQSTDMTLKKSVECSQCYSQRCQDDVKVQVVKSVGQLQSMETDATTITNLSTNTEQENVDRQSNPVTQRNSVREVNLEDRSSNIPHPTSYSNQLTNEDSRNGNSNLKPHPVGSTVFHIEDTLLVTNGNNISEESTRRTRNVQEINPCDHNAPEKSARCEQCYSQWCILSEKLKLNDSNSINFIREKEAISNANINPFNHIKQEVNDRKNNPVMKRNSVREVILENCNGNIPHFCADPPKELIAKNKDSEMANVNNNFYPVFSEGFNCKDKLVVENGIQTSVWNVMVPPAAIEQPGFIFKSNGREETSSYDSIKTCFLRETSSTDNNNNSSSPGISPKCSKREIFLDQTDFPNRVYSTHLFHLNNQLDSKEDSRTSGIDINNYSTRHQNKESSVSESNGEVEKQKMLQVSYEKTKNLTGNATASTIGEKLSTENEQVPRRVGTSGFVPHEYSFSSFATDKSRESDSSEAIITIKKKGDEKSVSYPPNVIPIIINVPNSHEKRVKTAVKPLSPKPTVVITDKNQKRKSRLSKFVPMLFIDQSSSQSRSSSNSNDSTVDDEDERKLIAKFINKHFNKKHVKSEKRQHKKSNFHSKHSEKCESVNSVQQKNFHFIPLGQMENTIQQQQYQLQPYPGQFFGASSNFSNNPQFLIQNSDFERTANLQNQEDFYQNTLQGSFPPRPTTIMQIVPDRNFVYDPYSVPFLQEPPPQPLQLNRKQSQTQFFPFGSSNNNLSVENPPGQHFYGNSAQEYLRNEPNKTTEFLEHVKKIQDNSSLPFPMENGDVENICRWLSPPPSASVRFDSIQGDEGNELYCYDDSRSAQGIRNEVHSTQTRTIMKNVPAQGTLNR